MKLTVLGSSSSGNCYVLQNQEEAIILEAGIKFAEVQNALDFNIAKVKACLITHEHGDHAKYIDQYMDKSIDVFASLGTVNSINYSKRNRPTPLAPMEDVTFGGFTIVPFDTQHDCSEPFGYLIHHEEIGTLLFATDTYYLKYKFQNLNNIMIECNYSNDILDTNVKSGLIHYKRKERVFKSHMSLKTTKETLLANNLEQVNNIILLHLSAENSNPKEFKRVIEEATGKRVTIAKRGVEILINKTPF